MPDVGGPRVASTVCLTPFCTWRSGCYGNPGLVHRPTKKIGGRPVQRQASLYNARRLEKVNKHNVADGGPDTTGLATKPKPPAHHTSTTDRHNPAPASHSSTRQRNTWGGGGHHEFIEPLQVQQ